MPTVVKIAGLTEAMSKVVIMRSNKKAWENMNETVFELLRRSSIECSRNGTLGEFATDAGKVEETWLFLLEVRARHKTRRKRVAESIRALSSDTTWAMHFHRSAKVQEALHAFADDVQAEIRDTLQIQAPSPQEEGFSKDGALSHSAGSNPWAAGAGSASAADPWATISGGAAVGADPWAARGPTCRAGSTVSSATANPWGGAAGGAGAAPADPWAASASDPWTGVPAVAAWAAPDRKAASPGPASRNSSNPWARSEPSSPERGRVASTGDVPARGSPPLGQGGGSSPSRGRPALGSPQGMASAMPGAVQGTPPQGTPPQRTQPFASPGNPWATGSPEVLQAGAAAGAAWSPPVTAAPPQMQQGSLTPQGQHRADHALPAGYPQEEAQTQASMTARMWQAARDANQKHDITGKVSFGAGVAARKAGEAGKATWQVAKEQDDKHDISGKVGHGACVAAHKTKDGIVVGAHKTREFDQKYQVSATVAEGARNAAKAMKQTNDKHNITGKVAHGSYVAASATASGVSKGYNALKAARSGDQQQPPQPPQPPQQQQQPPQQQQQPTSSFNPFGAPQDGSAASQSRPSAMAGPMGFGAANPFATQPHGTPLSTKDKMVNKAASQYTGGLVSHVPPAATDAAIDYARRNPQEAARLAGSAMRASKNM